MVRLDSARDERARLSTVAEEARGTAGEASTQRELDIAAVDETARAAWLRWVESGV